MKRATIAAASFALIVVLLALAGQDLEPAVAISPPRGPSAAEGHQGHLYGRVTTDDGALYEGMLRWGGDEEALWGHYFNGFKAENPWAAYAPSELLPKERPSFRVFGIDVSPWERRIDLGRPFMARFGHIARIEPRGRDLVVVLKSGSVFHLDRFAADDMNDDVRVWDRRHGVVDLSEWRIRSIEFLDGAPSGTGADPLHGTVRTAHGDFTGLVQWDREQSVGSDELEGRSLDDQVTVRFDAIRSIARRSDQRALVTLIDGRELVLSGRSQIGHGGRGIYVDDPRYGRVLISWGAFERVDFSPGGTAPAYGAFPPGHPLTGRVTTRAGRRLAGRLVYDLDEGETTETLDARSQGVDYTIPFRLVSSIMLPGVEASGRPRAAVSLRSGETLPLELTGDLGEWNAGLLVFDDRQAPTYVPWTDVAQIDLDGLPQMPQ